MARTNGWISAHQRPPGYEPKAVKLLLENHADPNIPKSYSRPALCLAKTAEIAGDALQCRLTTLNAEKTEDHIV